MTGPTEGVNMQPGLSEQSPTEQRSPAKGRGGWSPLRSGCGAGRGTAEGRAGLTAAWRTCAVRGGGSRACGEVGASVCKRV